MNLFISNLGRRSPHSNKTADLKDICIWINNTRLTLEMMYMGY